MTRTKAPISDREQRTDRRRTIREATSEKVQALREWRQARALAARNRSWADAEARRKQPRGVDRVPACLQGLAVTVEPYLVSKRGTELARAADLHPSGNYETRRARGHRGHQRPTRRRDLPGALARRIERNRKSWA